MKLFKVLLSIWERHGTEQVKEKGYRADGVVEGEAAASAVEAAMDRSNCAPQIRNWVLPVPT